MTLVVLMATAGFGLAAAAEPQSEAEFLAEINGTRAANGLAPLTVDGGLQSHARVHTQEMVEAGSLFHSTSEELAAAGGSGWSKLGENVGRGGSVSSLHEAFMDSPGHRANILGDYNYVGIGTANSIDKLYVTVVFMKKNATPTTTTNAAPTSTTLAPPTTPAPTTTSVAEDSTTTDASTTSEPATTTTPPTTTTSVDASRNLVVGPDKPVTPGESCLAATRFGWVCHD